jgi:1-acyl-sn-glycerol-3-phosphate acyltransferase
MALRLSRHPLRAAYAIYFGLWTVIWFIIVYPFIRIGLSSPTRYRFAHLVRKFWGKMLLMGGFMRVKMEYEVPLDRTRSYMIVPNHTSQLDIVTLTVKLPLFFNFMAKAELERIPVFGIWFRTIDIAVDRKDARKGALAYRKALNWIDQGNSMVIFPEGTISNQVPKLIKFKDGPFKMAIEKQIPLLPVTIIGNWELLPDQGVFEGRPGFASQYIHKPIETKGLTMDDIEKLKEQVFTVISNKLQEHGH